MSGQVSAEPPTVPAIVLAAGASARLGRPKQLLRIAGSDESLLDRAVRLARQAGAAPVFVVLGAHAEEIQREARLLECEILHNPEWPEGMASSLRAGIRAVLRQCQSASGALLLVCDQPALSTEHLQRLIAAHRSTPDIPSASRYAGRDGVPVVLPAAMFAAALGLVGDQGAKKILQQAAQISSIEFPSGEWDVDRPEDLQRVVQ